MSDKNSARNNEEAAQLQSWLVGNARTLRPVDGSGLMGWALAVLRERCVMQTAVSQPVPYMVGNYYRTQAGELVRFVDVTNEGNSYETMVDESGIHRYTRRDFGRVTGSAHDYSDPRNVAPLYNLPPAKFGFDPAAPGADMSVKTGVKRLADGSLFVGVI